MQPKNNPSPRRLNQREIGWVALSLALTAVVVTSAFVLGLPQTLAAGFKPPSPTITRPSPIVHVENPPTALPSASPPPISGATPTAIPATPEPTLEPLPSPTRFWIVPANPEPIPTPVLPAAAPFPTACDGPGRMNILLIGIDGANDNNYQRAARSDTIILIGVNFKDKTAQMLSMPRDLWVQLPNITNPTEARINTAYHYGELYGAPGGGPGELSAVLANTFGLRVDRYVTVNFNAFIQGIDAIGGVDINISDPIHDDKYPLRDGSGTIVIDFPEGQVHMDGATALIYARIRHDSSDFKRMRRQQQVMFAARDKLLSPEALPHLPALVQVLWGAARTDLSFEDLALLGCLAPQINTSAIQTWVVDTRFTTPTKFDSGAQVLLPNLPALQPILEQFNTGE